MIESRACILSISGPRLTTDEARLLADAAPWGVILMGRSCVSPSQVRALVDEIWAATGRPTLIFIDQEGGRVRRLRPPNWPEFPAAARYGALYERDRDLGLEAAWLGHRLIAAELEPLGIHADCAPVVDLRHDGAHSIVGDRSFGATPEQVGALARAALGGLAAGGVAGVIKHMPGHGRAEADSHESLPVVTAGGNALAGDFAAFAAVVDAPMAMTAHIAYPALDGMTAATVSPKIIGEVIRREIGFDGLLMTDDLGMNALGGALTDRAHRALAAGCDVVLHCSGFAKDAATVFAEMTEVAEAAPILSGDALRRAEAAERATLGLGPFDRAEGWARLEKLLADAGPAAA
ncbi:MAG: beta-N-acetylhexosaminidase [Alphaproteobacteria bacterium]|nr:beta-N-acetylhexosaminidase [Alphaproteobacteria bacterium]